MKKCHSGLSSLGVPGVHGHTQILEDQLTLFPPGGTDYAHLITSGTPGFSDLPTALVMNPISKMIFLFYFCQKAMRQITGVFFITFSLIIHYNF